ILATLDLDAIWDAATEQERRTLLDELLDRVTAYPDHLEVHVHGVPRLNVTLDEVGLGAAREKAHEGGASSHPPRSRRSRLFREGRLRRPRTAKQPAPRGGLLSKAMPKRKLR